MSRSLTTVGGLDALAVWAGLGTAVGTLGLAIFTWMLASQTALTVAASQRIEQISQQQLHASGRQLEVARDEARAASSAALEARRARIDAIAPLLDVDVRFATARYVPPGSTGVEPLDLAETADGWPHVPFAAIPAATFHATFDIQLRNFGRTPAYAHFTHQGISLVSGQQAFRVEPGELMHLEGRHGWRGSPPPDEPFAFELHAEIHGPMTHVTRDNVVWSGEITLLRDFGYAEGATLNWPEPLKLSAYTSRRTYDDAQRVAAAAAVEGT